MVACPACGRDSPDGFQFCGFCGAALAAEHSGKETKERKVVTVLFCDLVGFTAASESADPEEVQARIAPYHARTRDRIEAFGGTVEKFIGDAVMAVFGAPVAHEDDAERAVRAGLAILDGIEELNAADASLGLSLRIGLNTGEAVVSLDARPEQGEGMVTGDVVNTAARIQSAAPIDGVAVGEATFRATDRVFEYEPLEAITAKGKSDPVPVWRAVAPVARFGSDVIRSLTTPLVGRETDLTLLRSLFDKTARDREIQLVTVVGEPGVGKSRLVAELFAYIDELQELITWRQGRCLPYGDGITFWALGEIVKAHAGIYESDSADEATGKLEALLPENNDRAWLLARLLPLLGVESGQPSSREESFAAWRRFLEGIAEEGPLVLVVEDIHWADEALLAFLEHLADWAHGVPMLVVCTARPELYERHSSWGSGLANQTAIRLSPLSDTETAKLVAALLEQAVLPAETQQLLLERAGGNPLYAEEFVRMLRDRNLLDEHGALRPEADVPFPDSIHALIAARLDGLSGDRKQLLQDAAVIGKVFWFGALLSMGERAPDDVEVALHELSRKELVRPARQSSMAGESEYGFWHALVRDVAYGQIPRAQRADRHLAAARWIEKRAGERVEDLADVLAYHAWEALELVRATGDAERLSEAEKDARRFAVLAGERASGLDPTRALTLLDRALDLTPEGASGRGPILLHWGRAAHETGRPKEAVAALEQSVELASADGDVETVSAALRSLSELQYEMGTAGWQKRAERAVAVLEEHAPGRPLVDALASLAGVRMLDGRYREAIVTADRAAALALEVGIPPPARALSVRGSSRCPLGDRMGLDDHRSAIKLGIAAGELGYTVRSFNNLAIDTFLLDGPRAALAVVEEGMAFAAQRGLTHWTNWLDETRAAMFFLAGELQEVVTAANRTIANLEDGVDLVSHADALVFRTLALAEQGSVRVDDAAQALAESRQLGFVEALVSGIAVAARVRAVSDDSGGASKLLGELRTLEGVAGSPNLAMLMPGIVRTALSVGDVETAEHLVAASDAVIPMLAHSLASCTALLSEARRDTQEAAAGFVDAAEGWEAFGCGFEQAYALLGQGRCLVAGGDPGGDRPLRDARRLFDAMGARPAIAECDALLAQAMKISS
jgi:class 3 adenylate cyclase/tetratricopeptide (TPR) repeat protein